MDDNRIISRIAPTPSGYLHLGNALNFLIAWEFVRKNHGKLMLRIDDADSTRSRPLFIEDIFRTLEWLGIDWDLGPSGPDDFSANYSQHAQREKYFTAVQNLERTYSCGCSRKIIRKTFGNTVYGGSCRAKNIPFVRGYTAKRIIVDRPVENNGEVVDLGMAMGDFVLWTKDDTPAYQLVSLVEDEMLEVTHIFRGADLGTSTLAQKYLAQELGYASFLQAEIFHHELMYDPDGCKLAKSGGAASLKEIRESGKDKEYVFNILGPYLKRVREQLFPR